MTQSRQDEGPIDEFNRTWAEYEVGFGSCSSNYWLGLEAIAALTAGKDQELRIELEDWTGEKRFAHYENFSVSRASDFYRLSVGGFLGGDAGDSLVNVGLNYIHNGMRFSISDNDNDLTSSNCASTYPGGWWFNACSYSNLNGLYRDKATGNPWAGGIHWYKWKDHSSSLAKTEMKIRTKK